MERTFDTGLDCTQKLRVVSLKWVPGEYNLLMSAGWDRTMKLWDQRVSRSVLSWRGPYMTGCDSLDVSAAHHDVLTGAYSPEDAMQLWDMGSGKVIQSIHCISSQTNVPIFLNSAQFSRDGNSICAAGSNAHNTDGNCVLLLDTASNPPNTLGGQQPPLLLTKDNNNNTTTSENNEQAAAAEAAAAHPPPVTTSSSSSPSSSSSSSSDLFRFKQRFNIPGGALSAQFSPEGKTLAVAVARLDDAPAVLFFSRSPNKK